MSLTTRQETAIAHPCLLAQETLYRRYIGSVRGFGVALTLNAGWE